MSTHHILGLEQVPRVCLFGFFFQAEDGIRDVAVTGVQTCALPILQSIELTVPRLRGRIAGVGSLRPETRDRASRLRAGALNQSSAAGEPSRSWRSWVDRERGGEGERGELGGRRII